MRGTNGWRAKATVVQSSLILLLALLLVACRPSTPPTPPDTAASPTPTAIATEAPTVTSAAAPATAQPTPTATQPPTATATDTATPTPLPTSTPVPPSATPERTPTRSTDPVIHSFTTNPEVADPGDTITLTWSSTGGTHAILYRLLRSGQMTPDGWDVPPTGSMTTTLSPDARNWVSFVLFVWDNADRRADAGATVVLRCPDDWFFEPQPEDSCPTAPVVTMAAEQRFEWGVMIWIEAEDAIYVLYDGAETAMDWRRFRDEWETGMPERDPEIVPPPGLYQPIRGFGLLWRTHPFLREQLGWAVDEEQGYRSVMQRTTRFKYNSTFILALDRDVWYLRPEGSRWEKLDVAQLHLDFLEHPDG